MSLFKNVNVCYVYVRNWEAARKFYSELLGWPEAYASDEIGWVEWGEENHTHLAINRWDQEGEMPTGGTPKVVLTVDDAFKATEALRARGIRCDDVIDIPGVVTYGAFYDPEGNRLEFASSNALE
jgi:catechol 2,3-dioxygenase-like lactoylglutathione lyase family enzyme